MHNPLDHALALLLDGRLCLLVQRVEQLEEVVPPLVRPRRLDGDGLQDGLASLETLNLNKNRLGSLPAGVFAGLGSLKTLRLQQNPSLRGTRRPTRCA